MDAGENKMKWVCRYKLNKDGIVDPPSGDPPFNPSLQEWVDTAICDIHNAGVDGYKKVKITVEITK